MTHERQADIPVEIDAELIRCASDNGRISLSYLRDLWLRGFDHGHTQGYVSGLDEVQGDPKVAQIEAGFQALLSATGGEYSTEDHIVIGALTAAREFAVRLARLEQARPTDRDAEPHCDWAPSRFRLDTIGVLCRLVESAGMQVTFYGEPVTADELRGIGKGIVDEKMRAALKR